ncbi:hypothetical protein AMATHDRAFT_147745 [Amanita thiersii Skay4041]|uniref:EthD domain-containing protein n=1 Tax=Amanita thiersii Skay4041 TaxID=703135 RepID=A0A2A9NNZ2_9AGAR|nr:hypothetical protein AMATHDRAFT_147745 [Amanita thiersii Skay4041]
MLPSLLFVYAEIGDQVSIADFHHWYDNEHVPARLSLPGFLNALRYRAADDQQPSWIAMYDMASPDTTNTDEYRALFPKASQQEKFIIANLACLNRRVYNPISVLTHPSASLSDIPTRFLFVVCMDISPELEDDLNKWYEEEHLSLLAKVPGWLRGRRFKLGNHAELSGKPTLMMSTPTKYIALHDWQTSDFQGTPEFKYSIETPWSKKILGSLLKLETRTFELHKSY